MPARSSGRGGSTSITTEEQRSRSQDAAGNGKPVRRHGHSAAEPHGGLTPATASSDTLAPSSTITFPVPDSRAQPNTDVTISGLATDLGGGQVAGVEVSLDGGATWHRATGQSQLELQLAYRHPGAVNILSRAVDDSGNLEVPGTGVTFTISNYEFTAPGGPILVVTSAANPFTSYYAEILRAEGLNAFGLLDISQLDSTTLGQYDVVILGEMALTDRR